MPPAPSSSTGLKLVDILKGLGAILEEFAAGWTQIAAYLAFCEVSQVQSANTRQPRAGRGGVVASER